MRPEPVADEHHPLAGGPPVALKDMQVRKALAYALDRQLLNDTLYDGEAILTDSPIPPTSVWGPASARGAISYPYDLARGRADAPGRIHEG